MRALLLAAVLALVPALDGAESRRYDAAGRYMGRSERSGDTTRHYDALGRYTGRSTREGHDVRFYDKAGRYKGRSEAAPQRR